MGDRREHEAGVVALLMMEGNGGGRAVGWESTSPPPLAEVFGAPRRSATAPERRSTASGRGPLNRQLWGGGVARKAQKVCRLVLPGVRTGLGFWEVTCSH